MTGQTILLVEDNEDNRIVYSTILRHFGYAVLEANTGEDGLELAKRAHPALVLMDIGLPGMDGFETTQRLRSLEATRDIPVIALTAHALPEHRALALEVGCDDYLTKPVEPREVLATVRRHLATRGSEQRRSG
jgi:CheY-like chemotaxis protein